MQNCTKSDRIMQETFCIRKAMVTAQRSKQVETVKSCKKLAKKWVKEGRRFKSRNAIATALNIHANTYAKASYLTEVRELTKPLIGLAAPEPEPELYLTPDQFRSMPSAAQVQRLKDSRRNRAENARAKEIRIRAANSDPGYWQYRNQGAGT